MANWLSLAALGAAGMYLFDPQQGRRRRALLRDQMVSRARRLEQVARVVGRDIQHRLRGASMELLARASNPSETPDDVMVSRVRAKLGRHVTHPGAIHVEAVAGCVTLRGPVLAHEHADLLTAVRSVRGVSEVEDRLEPHEDAQGIPALQGESARRARRADYVRHQWSPAGRAAAAAGGTMLLLNGLRRGGAVGLLMGFGGAALFWRALSNRMLIAATYAPTQQTATEPTASPHAARPLTQAQSATQTVKSSARIAGATAQPSRPPTPYSPQPAGATVPGEKPTLHR